MKSLKPLFHHYLLAHTAKISGGIGVAGALAMMVAELQSKSALTAHPGVLIWIVLAAVPMAAIGWIVGVFFLWIPLGHAAARVQGWPFAVGDHVWILSGRDRDRITTVYEVWAERGQIRVDLGPERKDKFEDVFCAVEVCRARNTDPTSPCSDAQNYGEERR